MPCSPSPSPTSIVSTSSSPTLYPVPGTLRDIKSGHGSQICHPWRGGTPICPRPVCTPPVRGKMTGFYWCTSVANRVSEQSGSPEETTSVSSYRNLLSRVIINRDIVSSLKPDDARRSTPKTELR